VAHAGRVSNTHVSMQPHPCLHMQSPPSVRGSGGCCILNAKHRYQRPCRYITAVSTYVLAARNSTQPLAFLSTTNSTDRRMIGCQYIHVGQLSRVQKLVFTPCFTRPRKAVSRLCLVTVPTSIMRHIQCIICTIPWFPGSPSRETRLAKA
jgi:hypothetical protein